VIIRKQLLYLARPSPTSGTLAVMNPQKTMKIEDKINIELDKISFFDRAKYYILVFIGIVSIFSLVFALDKDSKDYITFIIIICITFGILISYKIYKTKVYLTDFHSDSQKVEIHYLNYSEEQIAFSTIEETEIILINTTSRTGFNCELEILIDNKKFIINNDFDWSFSEMKKIFEYIKFHKKENLTEKEKFILTKIEEKHK
jgi:hypothetical protein